MRHVKVDINVYIPDNQFTFESQNCYIQSCIALFKGMFPGAEGVLGAEYTPPVTVTVDLDEEQHDHTES